MNIRIDMVGVITSKLPEMTAFYRDVMGFAVKLQMDEYIEFENEGVRFALSTHKVMHEATGDDSYKKPVSGHSLEFAFRADSPEGVDEMLDKLVARGAKLVKPAANMPWGQRAGFFADPDGHVHEVFCGL